MTEDDILQALHGVNDPEVGVNIVDLGVVYSAEVDGERVRIVMTMTTPACPMHSYLAEEVRAAILDQFENVQSYHPRERERLWRRYAVDEILRER